MQGKEVLITNTDAMNVVNLMQSMRETYELEGWNASNVERMSFQLSTPDGEYFFYHRNNGVYMKKLNDKSEVQYEKESA